MENAPKSRFTAAYSVRGRLFVFLITAVLFIVLISLTAVFGLTRTYTSLSDLRDRSLAQMFSSMTLGVKTAQISTYATRLTQTINALEYQEKSRLLAEQTEQLHSLFAHIEQSALPGEAQPTLLIDSIKQLEHSVQELLLQAHQRHIMHTAILSTLHQMMLDLRHVKRMVARDNAHSPLLAQLDELNRILEAAAGSTYSPNMFAVLEGPFAQLSAFAGFPAEQRKITEEFAWVSAQAKQLEAINVRITFLMYQIDALVKRINTQYTDLAQHKVALAAAASEQIQEGLYGNILLIITASLLTILILAISGKYIYAVIGRRLYSIIAALKELSQGNRQITVPQQQRQDEIGDLARAFNVFHQNVILLEQTDLLLKEKSEWLEQTFLAMRDGLAIFDLQHTMLSCNTPFRALLPGFFEPPDAKRTLTDLADYFHSRQATISGSDAPVDLDALGKIRSKQEAFEIECQHQILEWRVSPLQGGLVAFLIDRTQRRQLETELAHSQKMRTIGHITGGIAHDFNNLLAVIIGNLDLVDVRSLTEKQAKYVRRALQAAENSATLTQRLLAYARKQPLHPAVLDIGRLIDDFRQLIKHTLPPGITFTLALAADLPPVYMDKNQLETALMNLIVNAKDAVGGSGHITIRAEKRLVSRRHRQENMLQLSVIDDGCGMTEDIQARVFEPFFTTKPGGKGSGLGLSMVYGFVRQSKGRVLVESAPGKGTAIHLQLPLASDLSPAAHTAPPDHIADSTGGGKVLLVEDQSALRDTLCEQLGDLGYDVQSCADGETALAVLAGGEAFDYLLSDIVLPGKISGMHVADAARQRHPGLNIVLMTGHYAADGEERSPYPVLKKPFKPEELHAALRGSASLVKE